MKITNIQKVFQVYKNNGTTRTQNVKKQQGKKDAVAISKTAQDYQLALKEAMKAPDIREQKVNVIKDRMRMGTYSVDSKEVADKLVERSFDLFK